MSSPRRKISLGTSADNRVSHAGCRAQSPMSSKVPEFKLKVIFDGQKNLTLELLPCSYGSFKLKNTSDVDILIKTVAGFKYGYQKSTQTSLTSRSANSKFFQDAKSSGHIG